MQTIISIAGKKQSGKSSTSNLIHGEILTKNKIISHYKISTKGELMVPVIKNDKEHMECLSLKQQSPKFISWANQNIWPFVKVFSIADPLKYLAINGYGLEWDGCYGTDEDKNKETYIRWSDIAFALPPRTVGKIKQELKFNEFLTNREFLETLGSEICRKICPDVWINLTVASIKQCLSPIIIIDDIRFTNELEAINKLKSDTVQCFNIKLLRSKCKSDALAEQLDIPDDLFNLVIDNNDLSLVEKNEIVISKLKEIV